jgi:hypothetical protein
MSERGVFAIDRGLFDHPFFADERFTEREAWAWMIAEAAWRSRAKRVGNAVVRLERGQLAASVRFLAKRWKWSKSRVDRFLIRLKTETMIGTDAETGSLVISTFNYDRYQRVALPNGTPEEPLDGTLAGQHRDKLENIERIKGGSERARPPFSKPAFDRAEQLCNAALGELAPCDPAIGPVLHLVAAKGYDLERQVIPAMIDVARASRSRIRTWRLLAEKAAERLAAPPIIPFPQPNGGSDATSRAIRPSAAAVARARLGRIEAGEVRLLGGTGD